MVDSGFFELFDTEPTVAEMDRLSLEAKGINGPVSVHKVEEIHTPDNFAFTTFSTGTTALQNVIGVTPNEIVDRCKASYRLFEHIGIKGGDSLLFTYPPLVNLFPYKALVDYGIKVNFLKRSSKASLLEALLSKNAARYIIGESSFLASAIKDSERLGLSEVFGKDRAVIAAGTPMSAELLDEAAERGIAVYDAYGCQEFGWIAVDGTPVRDDVSFMPVNSSKNNMYEIIVGGLSTGDVMPVINHEDGVVAPNKLITNSRVRNDFDSVTVLTSSTVCSVSTLRRAAKDIVRLKGKLLFVSKNVKLQQPGTVLEIRQLDGEVLSHSAKITISESSKTKLFDDILQAQLDYQANHRYNELWKKG